jgi:CcmD family protein
METLAMGFLAAWLALAAYMLWLGLNQQRLTKRLDAVEKRRSAADVESRSRAA